MYLFRPDNWFRVRKPKDRRAGGSGSFAGGSGRGGGNGGSTGSGSGGRGGTGSGSTGGSTGGRTGTTLRSGGSLGSGSQPARVTSPRTLGSAMKGPIRSPPRSAFYSSRSNRPLVASYFLLFGFWPIIWIYDYPEGSLHTNNTRPGGNLITASIIPSNATSNTTYFLYGDEQSVEDILPTLADECSAINGTAVANTTTNTTIQLFREDSFTLFKVGSGQTGRNTSFETCLNDIIGDNLIVFDPRLSGGYRVIQPGVTLWILVFGLGVL
jgi:hypothetical protein